MSTAAGSAAGGVARDATRLEHGRDEAPEAARRGGGHGDRPGGHDDVHGGAAHGTFKGYVTGFVLAAILTAIPFWLVMGDVLGNNTQTTVVILALGVVQIFVHMVYFLHLNTRSEGGWTVLALAFTVTLVVIMLAGSIWVMHHLNTNMMPMSVHDLLHHQP